MLEPEFRCRETTDPPHGYRPVRPPRPLPWPTPPAPWWDRLRHHLRRRLARPAHLAVGHLHPTDVPRILAEAADRGNGEEP